MTAHEKDLAEVADQVELAIGALFDDERVAATAEAVNILDQSQVTNLFGDIGAARMYQRLLETGYYTDRPEDAERVAGQFRSSLRGFNMLLSGVEMYREAQRE